MKNKAQTITARQGNRIMILEIFSAAAMFLPQIALKKSYHSGIIVVIIASVMTGIYLCITDCVAQGISIENILKISSRSHHLLCKIFTKWSFFLFVYFISYKKISPSRQIIISYWGSINFTGLSDESRRINKKGQSNGRDFLVRVTTDDLCSDPKCDKSIME